MPASSLVGLGVTLLAIHAAAPHDPWEVAWWHVVAAAVMLGGTGALWVAAQRPDVGSTD